MSLSIVAALVSSLMLSQAPAGDQANGLGYLASDLAEAGLLPSSRVFIAFGETHGVRENATIVADLAAQLHRDGYEVRVYLEQPDDGVVLSGATEASFLRSLSASAFWSGSWQDGRAGALKACKLFELQRLGIPLVPVDTPQGDGSGRSRDEEMADAIARDLATAVRQYPDRKIAGLFLVGNYHIWTAPGAKASAFDLVKRKLQGWKAIPIYIAPRSGSAYNCQAAGCGVHSMSDLSDMPVGLTAQGQGEYNFIVPAFTPDLPYAQKAKDLGTLKALCD